jgi:hypothetical protein
VDPDPGGLKTCGSGGSGSETMPKSILETEKTLKTLYSVQIYFLKKI